MTSPTYLQEKGSSCHKRTNQKALKMRKKNHLKKLNKMKGFGLDKE